MCKAIVLTAAFVAHGASQRAAQSQNHIGHDAALRDGFVVQPDEAP